jgi:signal transduction histidine kinase
MLLSMKLLRTLYASVERYLDVPESLYLTDKDQSAVYTARVINLSLFWIAIVGLLTAVVRFTQHDQAPFSLYFLVGYCFFNLALPQIARRLGSYWWPGMISLCLGTLLVFWRILDTGGLNAVAAAWLTLPPVVFSIILGTKAMIFAVVMCCAFLLVLTFVAHPLGFVSSVNETPEKTLILAFVLIVLHGVLNRVIIRQKDKASMDLKRTMGSLVQTRKLASLGTMATGIAHQINNPLMILVSQTELIRRELSQIDIPEDRKDLIERCSRRLEEYTLRIQSIVNALLIIGKSQPKQSFTRFRIQIVLDEVKEYLQQRYPQKQVEVIGLESIDEDIYGQPVLLGQLFLNLLINGFEAIENQERGWVKLEFQVEKENYRILFHNSGEPLCLSVRDNLFNPFFTTKPNNQGSGLGLVLSRTVAELHGGLLSYCEEAEHPIFQLELPRASA